MNDSGIAGTHYRNDQSLSKLRNTPASLVNGNSDVSFSDYATEAALNRSSPSSGYTMEEDGIELNQSTEDIWLGKQPNTRTVDKFLKLSGMTLAERIRFYYLEDRKMSESDLRNLPATEREEIEAEILRLIEEAIEAQREEDEKKKSDEKPVATVEPTASYEFSAYKLLTSIQTKPDETSIFGETNGAANSVENQDPIFALFQNREELDDLHSSHRHG